MQPATLTLEPPVTTTAVPRHASRMNPLMVTHETFSIFTSESATETTARPLAMSLGGQK